MYAALPQAYLNQLVEAYKPEHQRQLLIVELLVTFSFSQLEVT